MFVIPHASSVILHTFSPAMGYILESSGSHKHGAMTASRASGSVRTLVLAARRAVRRGLFRLRRSRPVPVGPRQHLRQLLAARRAVRRRAAAQRAPRAGRRWWLAAFAANPRSTWCTARRLRQRSCFSLANAVQSVAGAWLVRRFVAARPTLSTLKEFVGFLGYAAFLGSALGATIGAATLLAFGLSDSFLQSWKVWWGSNAMAILLLSPFILTWFAAPAERDTRLAAARRLPEAVLLVAPADRPDLASPRRGWRDHGAGQGRACCCPCCGPGCAFARAEQRPPICCWHCRSHSSPLSSTRASRPRRSLPATTYS